jgi:hypothetical protein
MKEAQPLCGRPKGPKSWAPELIIAIEHLVVPLSHEGFTTSEASVGCTLAHLVAQGAVESLPMPRAPAR